jgi:hypothetical protein
MKKISDDVLVIVSSIFLTLGFFLSWVIPVIMVVWIVQFITNSVFVFWLEIIDEPITFMQTLLVLFLVSFVSSILYHHKES